MPEPVAQCLPAPGDETIFTDVNRDYDPPLDEGIRHVVVALASHGVETFESCEGGDGHRREFRGCTQAQSAMTGSGNS